jgi:mannose-1-phosphate guanylyltransferase / phosphomannomutase
VKAVIMAGGEGTRLRPLTSNAPKPLLPIADRPMMEHTINLLRRHGFTEIVVTVAFMAKAIRDYFGDGREFGVTLTYVDEPTPLGTAGSVRNAAEHLDGKFLVISGDVITDIDVSQIIAFHESREAVATIGLTPVENPLEFGIVITREDGSIERFLEKPTWGQVFSDTINTGIYVLEPEILELIEPGRPADFSADVFPRLLRESQALYGAVAHGYWEDVGTLEAYLRAHKDVLDQMVQLDIPGFQVADGVWLGEGTELAPDVQVIAPAVVGPDCTIESGSRLGAYTVLGSHCRVLANVDLDRCVLHDSVYVASGCRLRGTVVGKGTNIRANVRTGEGVVLGDEVQVGANATLGADVKVYPFKTIDDGAVVNSSIVWESRGASSLFGRDGVSGLANVDITPELAIKLALAYGTSLRKGVTVVTSRDSSRSARMLKRALMAGLNSAGVNVLDLEVASTPVTRFLVKSPQPIGGLSVRLNRDDPSSVEIHFYDTTGMDISEEEQRRIERLFQREDYRRALPEEMGDISYPHRAVEDYTVELSQIVEPGQIAERQFKLVVDYGYGAASFAMASVLTKLRADVLGVNPYASTPGRLAFDHEAASRRVGDLVRASGAQLGAVFGPDGERLTLIDDEGDVLTHTEATLVFIELVCDHLLGDRIAVPVNMTGHAERIASQHGVTVQHTKISTPALMEAAREPGVGFAADGQGGYILPGFLPAFDAAAALVKMLDLLARSGRQLSEVRRGLPAVYMTHEAVATPWEQKGLVMRSLVEKADGELVLVDGVKVRHGLDWTLALPDPSEPVTHLWSEAATAAGARALSKDYARRIRRLVR